MPFVRHNPKTNFSVEQRLRLCIRGLGRYYTLEGIRDELMARGLTAARANAEILRHMRTLPVAQWEPQWKSWFRD